MKFAGLGISMMMGKLESGSEASHSLLPGSLKGAQPVHQPYFFSSFA
jgi:hypothetical protein